MLTNWYVQSYLEDFHRLCSTLGESTGDVMCEILAVSFNKTTQFSIIGQTEMFYEVFCAQWCSRSKI